MFVLLGLILLTGIFIGVTVYSEGDGLLAVIGFSGGLISGVALGLALLILSVNHATASYTIDQYNTIKETIEESRTNETTELERAALLNKIIETNEKIADYKWNNENYFDIFIPDEWAELEPLK